MIGLEAVLANMARLGGEINLASDEGRMEAGEHVRQAWVANIEAEGLVLTGEYRDSIRVAKDGDDAVVYTDVVHGGVLEHGDSFIPPHPVAERAADESHEDVLDAVANRVRGVLR